MWLTIISLPLLIVSAFVTNNASFPKPLTTEEEEKFLQLYSMGDETAKNILIEKNLRLVAHVVKKYHNTGYNADDLISIGTIGLIKAITTFDPCKGTRLATYAARCIENAILTKDHYKSGLRGLYFQQINIQFFSIPFYLFYYRFHHASFFLCC